MSNTRPTRPETAPNSAEVVGKQFAGHLKALRLADLLTIVLLTLFVFFVSILEDSINLELSGFELLVAGVLMSIVPAILWLGLFYRRDRVEPEPKTLILQVFLLGALLAMAVGEPVLDRVFHIHEWLYTDFTVYVLGSILVVGFIREFIKYAAVRFSIFQSDEFDGYTDGIIYATAAGLGYATVLNIQFVLASGGTTLGLAAIRIVLTALAHASFAGITGYFLGRERVSDSSVGWMASGIVLAAVLDGLFFALRGEFMASGFGQNRGGLNDWFGVIMAALLALAVTTILNTLIQRDVNRAIAAGEG